MGTVVEKFQYIEGTKQAIKKAIKGKGVEVLDTDTFRSYAEKIKEIGSGSGGGSSVAEYKFINTLGQQTYPAQPYSEDNNFIYPSFADYMSSDKEFCCTADIYDGYTGDVYKLFDGDETTYSAPSFFFRFNEKKKIKKLHIVITSADYWGGTPIIYGTNYSDHMTSQDTRYWTELYNFNGVVGEHIIDLSDANYQYFWFSDDRINVSKFEVITESGVIAMTLSSANMTPKLIPYADNYMQVITQDWHNGSEIIPSQTLIFKPYEDGGCLVNYNDDGKAVNLKMFLLNPTGETITKVIDFVQPVLTSNGTIGGDAFAVEADSVIDSNRDAFKAFDGNTVMNDASYDQWHSSSGQPHWIKFYNPNPLSISKVTIFNGADNVKPLDWEFQYSDDNNDWHTLVSGTNTELTQNGEWSFDVTNSGSHKYYRFYTTSSSGTDTSYLGLTEIQITGKVVEDIVCDKPIYVIAPDEDFTLDGYREKTQVADLNIPERLS